MFTPLFLLLLLLRPPELEILQMSTTHQNSIFTLPQDVIFDILTRIPTKSLIQFRLLSTSAPPLISHPSFTKLHLSSSPSPSDHRILIYFESTDYIHQFYSLRSPLTFRETLKLQTPYKHLHGYLRIVGSSKGLICLFDTNYYSTLGTVILWNPSIQKLKIVHDPVLDKFSHFVLGFGFVPRTFEFKVVEIGFHLDDYKIHNTVLVYSLGTNSWEKKKKEELIAPCYLNRGWSSNVFVNGFVNWLALKKAIPIPNNDNGESDVIMAFDLDYERFRVLELPKNIVPSYDKLSIDSFGEEESLCLAFCAHYFEPNSEKWDVWVMGEYGLVDSWKKVFVVSQPSLSIPPLLMKRDCEVLIVMNDGKLMLFDAVKNEMQDLETQGWPDSFRAIRYTASLALLHG